MEKNLKIWEGDENNYKKQIDELRRQVDRLKQENTELTEQIKFSRRKSEFARYPSNSQQIAIEDFYVSEKILNEEPSQEIASGQIKMHINQKSLKKKEFIKKPLNLYRVKNTALNISVDDILK